MELDPAAARQRVPHHHKEKLIEVIEDDAARLILSVVPPRLIRQGKATSNASGRCLRSLLDNPGCIPGTDPVRELLRKEQRRSQH